MLDNDTLLPQGDDSGNLRPGRLVDYIGQEKLKGNIRLFMDAALARNEPLDHVLLYGPPGLGKTTLANIIATEMGAQLRATSGPVMEKPGDIVSLLTNLCEGDVLFIDEIHRLPRICEEVLYSAMEDFAVDVVIGQGETARTVRLDLPRFTLVGATTRAGLLTAPLRDRFGITSRMEYYTDDELACIARRSALLLDMEIEGDGALELARRSRGTPRIANRILKRVRDFVQERGNGSATKNNVAETLQLLDIDSRGLEVMDRLILTTLIERFGGRPVGLEALAAAVGEDKGTIEDVYEPYLIQCGFIDRTPRGRVATQAASEHMGLLPE